MILDEYVYLNVKYNKILNYYKDLNYDCKLKVDFKVKVEDLRPSEKVKVNVKCEKCGKEKELSYNYYFNNKSNLYFSCSYKCSLDKVKNTCLERYGYDNAAKNPSVKEKTKKTCLDKYGGNSPLSSKRVLNKVKNTCLERYGYECSLQNASVKEKIKETCLERYGHINSAHGVETQKKIKKTNLEKYGAEHYTKSEFIHIDNINRKKYKFINKLGIKEHNILDIDINNITIYCEKCNSSYTEDSHFIHKRIIGNYEPCTNCYPHSTSQSNLEQELLEYIKTIYNGVILENDRKILNPQEIDIYLPDINLAFEFNGVYWHSDKFKSKDYHKLKTDKCLNKGIRLMHIYEDDWIDKKDIVKKYIYNLIVDKKILLDYVIREVDVNDSIQYLNDNHIDGYILNDISLGLYYNDEFIDIMSFVKEDNRYVIVRHTNNSDILFNYFINTYYYDVVSINLDRMYRDNNKYLDIGFSKSKKSLNENWKNRYNYIVYDSGKYEFVYKRKL